MTCSFKDPGSGAGKICFTWSILDFHSSNFSLHIFHLISKRYWGRKKTLNLLSLKFHWYVYFRKQFFQWVKIQGFTNVGNTTTQWYRNSNINNVLSYTYCSKMMPIMSARFCSRTHEWNNTYELILYIHIWFLSLSIYALIRFVFRFFYILFLKVCVYMH